MIEITSEMEFYGIYGEGRILCLSCAQRIYGTSLEMYLDAGDVQKFSDQDRSFYACKGLLCDECPNWIFQPDEIADAWWRKDPDPDEYIRLLAPFAIYLDTLRIDVSNFREGRGEINRNEPLCT